MDNPDTGAQRGLGDIINRLNPTKIPNIKALQVSAGDFHIVVIDLENNVWTIPIRAHSED